MSTSTLERPIVIDNSLDSESMAGVAFVPEKIADKEKFIASQEVVADGIIHATKGNMTEAEKLKLGMDLAGFERLLKTSADRSLEAATIRGDGIPEGEAELETVKDIMASLQEVVADVYLEKAGTIAGRTKEILHKTKMRRRLGKLGLRFMAGGSVMAATAMGAPLVSTSLAAAGLTLAVPHVPGAIASGLRFASGKVRDGVNKKIEEIPLDKLEAVNAKIAKFEGTEQEADALRSLLIAELLLEPLKAELLSMTGVVHQETDDGQPITEEKAKEQRKVRAQLAADLAHASTEFLLDLYGLSDVRKFSGS